MERDPERRPDDEDMIGSEAQEPGPGRDTSLTDPDPVASSADQPRGTVAMSDADPLRTRLGAHLEGAGAIGYDVAAEERQAAGTEQVPPADRPAYAAEADDRAASATAADPTRGYRGEAPDATLGRAGEPDPATYTGEEADVAGRPEYADKPEPGGTPVYGDEPARIDRPGGEGSIFGGAGPPGEPDAAGVDRTVDEQEAERAKRLRDSNP